MSQFEILNDSLMNVGKAQTTAPGISMPSTLDIVICKIIHYVSSFLSDDGNVKVDYQLGCLKGFIMGIIAVEKIDALQLVGANGHITAKEPQTSLWDNAAKEVYKVARKTGKSVENILALIHVELIWRDPNAHEINLFAALNNPENQSK